MTSYNVSNSGSGAYIINGLSNPTLNLFRGITYTFSINASGHPFWIQTTTIPYNSANVYNSGVTGNGTQVGTLTFNVPLDAPNTLYYVCQFHASMNGIINITNDPTPCFKENSKILAYKNNVEQYIEIQDLRKGDLVKTLDHGYIPINMIGKRDILHSHLNDRDKNGLYKCVQENYPEVFEDLIITGCHSILVDSFLNDDQRDKTNDILGDIYITDSKYRLPACVDERAIIYEKEGTFTIYHIALDNENYYYNYGIYANGLLVESCSKRYLKEISNMELI